MNYKKIYDSVHGFIKLTPLEKDLLDLYAMQRLRYIHQVGVAYMVYPGARHTRFEHSLGVMEISSQIFDRLLETSLYKPEVHSESYWRQVVRFAALCHDLGHLPFSHLAEKKILGSQGHEAWTALLIQSDFLMPIWKRFLQDYPESDVVQDIIKISIGEDTLKTLGPEWGNVTFSPWEKVMSRIISGNFFGADRIDYLLRDARFTGVSYGLFDYRQLIEMLRICACPEGRGLTLAVEENGLEACEALLLARHFMHKRVYQYPTVQAYSFHMARFMEKLYKKAQPIASLQSYLSYTDNEVLVEVKKAFLDPDHESYKDAQVLFSGKNRYLAIALPFHITQDQFSVWLERSGIDPEKAQALFTVLHQEPAQFSFPVMRGEKVLSKIPRPTVSIPSFSMNWLYIDREYESLLVDLFEGG